MIFSEDTLRRRDYRLLYEERASGCLKNADGTFAPKNQCQDDGAGGGGSQPTPKADDSWRNSSDDVELSREQLTQSSPIKGGDKIDSLAIQNPRQTSAVMKSLGVKSLDDMVAIGGGAVRGARIVISDLEDDGISISTRAPIDPSDPKSPSATGTIIVMPGSADDGVVVDYSNFATASQVSDASKQEGGENSARRLRVASILKQRMLESLMAAEASGFGKAATMAIGSKGDPNVKGYRLWPQFGFDAKIPRDLAAKIPDEIILRAAGISIPAPGSSRLPHATVLRGLRSQVREITVQQLMQFREGENWWTEHGSSIEMSLDLRDKSSLGYKRFQKEQKKLPSLRRRNEGRSWYPIDDAERRSCDDSDKNESGQFTTGNDCGSQGGGGSTPKPLSRAKREKWRESEDGYIEFDASQMKQGSPLIGGEKVKALTIQRPQRVAESLDRIGVKDLDTAVKIGGGAIRESEIRVKGYGDSVSVMISSPVDPDDPDGGDVVTSVEVADYGDGLEVHYGGLNTPGSVSDPARLEAGARDKTRLRIASLMQERMIESLMAAQKAGAFRASTYAVGDSEDAVYQGYRLWPQFGFDAKLDLNQHPVPAEIVLASFKKKVPESPQEAAKQAKKLTSKGFTLQQLISTREGKKWWDDNGSSLDMYLDLKDRKSLGYKRLAKLKRILPKLKERNVAEGRTLLGWLIEEVTRRSMSLVDFLGGLGRAVERRDCGPSDKEADGTFAKGNNCQEGAGEGEKKKPAGSPSGALAWESGKAAGGVTSRARENPGTVRSDDGKSIVSTPIEGAHIYEFPKGVERIATVDVGAHLASEQDKIRGGRIDTSKKVISGPEAEYILASITEQAQAAIDRGIEPKFYSPEEREEQLAAFASMIPEVRGGRTKAGAMIEQEDAENLFRVLQAITSPNASPFINMQRTDSLLQKFFYGDGMVTTSDSLGVTGAGIKKSLRRFQKIVDTLGKRTDGSIDTAAGLRAARELLQGRSLRVGDIEKFFADFASPGEKKGTWKPGSYLVDEVVPVFSTFGPKVGPFYANNNGDLDPLTADVWFSRTWGRVTGELVIPGSPTKSAKQASELAKIIGKASEEQLHGVSAADLSEAVKQTSKTGAVSDTLRAWAGARLRHYARGDYKEKTGLGGKLNRLAKNIVENDTSLIGDPGSGSRRSHMIRLMREASRQTGVPVAYLQDILWQDEQDAYGALGAKTATNVGEPSLYSDQIRKLAANNGKSRKPRASVDRGYRRDYEQPEPFFDDYERGGREQMLWDAALAHLSDEEFADAVIQLAAKARPTEEFREERRNFAALDAVIEIRSADCGRVEGGRFGPKNQCQEEGSSGSEEQQSPSWARDIEHSMKKSRGYDDPANRLAWLNLSGTFYPVSGDHGEFAAKHGVEGGGEDLLDAGWLRVAGIGGDTLFVGNSSGKPPKQSQVSALRDFAISTGIVGRVVFDDGRSRRGRVLWQKEESRSADCGRDDGGKFGDGNTCAGWKGSGPSNSKGESFRGVRRKTDKTQTKVARKLYQMRINEKQLKALVRDLGGKVSNTLVEIDSTKGDEGVNVYVRDRDNNETHYIHVGYYGATIYPTDRASAAETSRIQSVAKASLPKTIDDRLWAGGSEYPVYVVNDPAETAKQWGGKSAKQRLKKERRSADCGRVEGGKFGPNNQCQGDEYGLSVKSEESKDAWGKKSYSLGGQTKKNYRYDIKDDTTGGRASLKVGAYEDYSDGDFNPKATAVTIVSWSATPLSAIADKGLKAQEDYVGKGFGRRVFSQALEIARKHDADVISVFAPSEDTQAVMERYTSAGVVTPIESSKAVSGDFYTDFRINKEAVAAFIAETKRRKKDSRSADCGRVEGGRFGPKNQCQDDGNGGGTATASKPKSPLDTNENKSWTAASGDEPFEGASRYKEVSASGGKKVAESLEKTGLSPGEALAATGAPERSEVWMRPAPEFAREFPGSDTPPVMVNFDADVAGVRRGLSGSSVIGSANGEKVVYHSVFDASPSVQSDPAKRHIAARALYRTMVASIEAARKNGIAEIKFNAAGVSSEKSPSAFRGYTIWPRMGFDAKLPDRIRAKLPESLSHATSLLDLHATREGTKWWAENGEDIDVSFRVGDRSSPQSKIMDRFIKHFMKERREMPLGTGDDWLSPEDLLRLDEMWQEVWDEGDLDDYEYVEQRSADCGRTEDGRFGPKNECQEEGAGGGSEPKKMLQASTRKEAAAYASMLPGTAEEDISKAVKKTRGPDRFGVVGSAARNLPVGDAKATKDYSESTIREVGGFQAKFAEDVAKRLSQTVLDAESSRFPGMAARAARDNAAAAIASIISAAEEMPEVHSERLRASTAEEIAQMFSADDPSTDIEIHRRQASGTGALYSTQDDTITFNTDGASQMIASLIANDSMRKGSKGFSTSQVAHALVHEVGHRIHLQAIRKSLGIPINTRATNDQMAEITFDLNSRVAQAQAYIKSRPETVQDIRNLSLYAATSPMETVAEYYVGVKIGKVKRTETLDRVVEILGFPVSELSPAKKQRARKS